VKVRVSNSLQAHAPHGEQRRECAIVGPDAAQVPADFDDLSREVFGVLGIPLDAIDVGTVLRCIDASVDARAPFWLSTPNVNFLMMSRSDQEFRESLLMSDCCPADGMPLVWISRLLGIPIRGRVSGADIFHALRSREPCSRRLNVFLFGGAEGVAETVCQTLNREEGGLKCVGVLNPGFGSTVELSSETVLNGIDAAEADLLTVFLSAKKAQGWLLRNHSRLKIPFRAQFGATINLQAGRVKRAPLWIQKLGFEWLWRIKEEPYLWRRYWNDGCGLFYVMSTCLLPLVVRSLLQRSKGVAHLTIERTEEIQSSLVKLSGAATSRHIAAATACFRVVLEVNKPIVIDLSKMGSIDPRFFGLLLMLRKKAIRQELRLEFVSATPNLRKIFRLNGFEFLLNATNDRGR
jgi:N-acetylglucosaminyldiphosphoundecaprenol N-acetyl-beta-D-mannosaminyltransferase